MRIEKVGGNRERATVSSLRQLFEVNEEKFREVSRHFGSSLEEESNLGTFLLPLPEGDSKAGFGVAIFFILNFQVKSVCVGVFPLCLTTQGGSHSRTMHALRSEESRSAWVRILSTVRV
ncbi:hypothetical protein E2C01_005777 [Portunus trituberculatus]|uniref:Uncharacterized protein n=1 Tax=Portunus trituberculatus TaxID=210409 RepID=A0A5B7CT97_PORTR|nr:hypothetical protein [Portunus trituberculatus]